MRVAAVIVLSQPTLEVGTAVLSWPWQRGGGAVAAEAMDSHGPCFRSAGIRQLAALPPGLVAADLELGPYIVALSPHRVVAAPYHRLEKAILANRTILHGQRAQGQRQLRALAVDYVVLCAISPGNHPSSRPAPPGDAGLRAQLLGGAAVDFLREVPLPSGSPIKVWQHSSAGAH
jgi:hypothetical protein